ncbi:MAG: GGDEF domain-containing protein [Bdellovibrio sp.]|nr:GGDEF domain-containing protein [Methylotenera sp.]
MSKQEKIATEASQEVEISYTEQAFKDKLSTQGLNSNQVTFALKVNKQWLAQAEQAQFNSQSAPAEINAYLAQLAYILNTWQACTSFAGFSITINQLIFLWLNAMQDGVTTQTILRYLRCFELNSTFGINQSPKLHCFLFELVAETLQQHHLLQLEYALNFDANTQLPHANQLLLDVDNLISHSHTNQLTAVFSLRFQVAKNNPIFSHTIAMSLSKQIAAVLLQNIQSHHKLYFSSNLQFDLLIPEVSNIVQLNILAAKLSRVFEELIFLESQSVLVTPFIGCALLDQSYQKIQDLPACANLALESALISKQSLVIYSEDLQTQLTKQNALEKRVLDAFASDSLTLFFQPIMDLKTSTCVGAELLLRWSESAGPSVYPSLTVEILNKVGKGKLFTRWLVNSACRYASELLREHHLNVYLTLNLRAEDLYDSELPHMLTQVLALWTIEPKNIILEVTEDGILEMNETTNEVIKQLAESGFRLALDDFGTGFSSLSRLRTMPIDLIKIDQSFVRNIEHSKDDLEIVKSIALLANSLGKEALAEGVEDEACLNIIKKLNIHKCQGYYFAKPMPFELFTVWAKQNGA